MMAMTLGEIAIHTDAAGRIQGPAVGPLVLAVGAATYGPRGTDARMGYALAPTRFGQILLAATVHGVTWIGIHDSATYLEGEFRGDYPAAEIVRDPARVAPLAAQVAAVIADATVGIDLPVDIRATPFQLRVWRELCAIPRGTTRSYGDLARRLGQPTASRAVGHANGANPTAIVIPCHRVIGADGTLTGYRWGIEYKRRLLEQERRWSG